jgi:hypothetical protein
MRTGLFENVEREMSEHRFKADDIVTVFQMCPRRGLMVEGKAVIVERIEDVDEQYMVTFISEPGATYERFVDAWGQSNPKKYVQDFNRKIGKVA